MHHPQTKTAGDTSGLGAEKYFSAKITLIMGKGFKTGVKHTPIPLPPIPLPLLSLEKHLWSKLKTP